MKAAIQPEIAQRLSHQGLEVSTRYTWEQSANLHLTHYRQFLQTHIG